MPYVLWEYLHRVLVRNGNEFFMKNNHPMLHISIDQWRPKFVQSPNAAQKSHKNPTCSQVSKIVQYMRILDFNVLLYIVLLYCMQAMEFLVGYGE